MRRTMRDERPCEEVDHEKRKFSPTPKETECEEEEREGEGGGGEGGGDDEDHAKNNLGRKEGERGVCVCVCVCDDGGGGAWAAVEKKSQGCIKFRLEVWKASSLARSPSSLSRPHPPQTTLKRANSRDERLKRIYSDQR